MSAVTPGCRAMIRQQGSHRGKQIVFGFDRHLMDELELYAGELAAFGAVLSPSVQGGALHYLSASEWVCRRVSGSPAHVGVLVCANGLGVSIAANKFPGVYAARCLSVEDAELARVVNNANVVCLSARATFAVNRHILGTFLSVPYEGRRLEQLERIAELGVESTGSLRVVSEPPAVSRQRVG